MSQSKAGKKKQPGPQLVKKALIDQAAEAFRNETIDNSPKLENATLRDVLEQVSALNLGDLSHELTCLAGEIPSIVEICDKTQLNVVREGLLMAIAFESGRRYMLLQAFQILSEEIEILPTEHQETTTGPILEKG